MGNVGDDMEFDRPFLRTAFSRHLPRDRVLSFILTYCSKFEQWLHQLGLVCSFPVSRLDFTTAGVDFIFAGDQRMVRSLPSCYMNDRHYCCQFTCERGYGRTSSIIKHHPDSQLLCQDYIYEPSIYASGYSMLKASILNKLSTNPKARTE